MRLPIKSLLLAGCMHCAIVSAAAASPAELGNISSEADAQKLMQMLEDQQQTLADQEKQLKAQQERVRLLTSQVNKLLNTQSLSNLSPAAGSVEEKAAPETEQVGTERKPKERDRPPEVEAVGNSGGVLLRPGQAVLEPAIEYTRSSALRVAIEGFTIIPALNIGSFEISEVDRDTVIGSVTGRMGVFDDFEAEIRVPYVYRADSTLSRPLGTGSSASSLTNVSGDNIGDVEIGARYQFLDAHGNWPFLIGNLRFKTTTGTSPFEVPTDPATGLQTELPTGSGFYSISPSVTAIMPSDPVVLYASLGYLYNMKQSFGGGIGEIDPGDSISASFGMGFSLNEKTSFSLGYAHNLIFETMQNGQTITNSNELHVGRMLLGFGYRATDETSINLNFDAGVTDDAPDARIMVRVPMRFNLF